MYYNDNSIPKFNSKMADFLYAFITYKRSMGLKYGSFPCYTLKNFDNLLIENNIEEFNSKNIQSILDLKISNSTDIKKSTNQQYYLLIYDFIKYLVDAQHIKINLPNKIKFKSSSKYIPYIFSSEEINSMFKCAYEKVMIKLDRTSNSFFGLLCLYYGSGLRLNEAINLKLKNFNNELNTIDIRNSKNDVSRTIPLSKSVSENIKKVIIMNSVKESDDYIFQENKCNYFRKHIVYSIYKKLLLEANIKIRHDGKTQRIHDLRHTFCSNAIHQMEVKGLDTYTTLPILSLYLGHKSIIQTEYYLKMIIRDHKDLILKVKQYTQSIYSSEVTNESN